MIVVSDAGPLIALAKINKLYILKRLFEKVKIPPSVFNELKTSSSRIGADELNDAITKEGWLEVTGPSSIPKALVNSLDQGEAEAIILAGKQRLVLLIDERRGRRIARKENVKITGTGAILAAAKRNGIIPRVSPVIDELITNIYRISSRLRNKILALAEEM